jgi:hypothetical protein
LQEDTLADQKDDKTSYSAELLYGYINKNYQSFTVAYRHEEKWNSEDPRDICSPLSDGSTSLACQSIAIAAPQDAIARVLSLEWKTYFGKNDSKGIALKLSRDFETDITGLDVPIYLYQDKKTNGLQGGVRIGYLKNLAENDGSKSDSDVQFSLFFNKAFSIK